MKRYVFLVMVMLLAAVGVPAAEIGGYTPASDKALSYSVRLGPGEGAPNMVLVLDESGGTGKGYDIAVADLDLDGRLDDQEPVPKTERGRSSRYVYFTLETTAPFGNVDSSAKYGLNLYVFAQEGKPEARPPYSSANVKLRSGDDAWEYRLSGYLEGDPNSTGPTPVALGEPVAFDTTPKVTGDVLRTKVGIKDKNGLSMRGVVKNGKTIGPHLTITAPDGSTVAEQDMRYG